MTTLSFRTVAAQTLPGKPPQSMRALVAAQYYDGEPPPPPPGSPGHAPDRYPTLRAALKRGAPPRYDQIFRKAGHNTYERKYSSSIAQGLDRTRTIEIDFYDENDAVASKVPIVGSVANTGGKKRHWYVRHDPASGNDSCCSGAGGLADCLRDVRLWSDAHPGHEVITVFLDKKQQWSDSDEGRTPADLDALLLSCFPRQKLFVPADLKGAHSSLRSAARKGAWPLMTELRDKITLVITGGSLGSLTNNGTQAEYVSARGSNAVMFVAPDTNEESDILEAPNQFSKRQAEWVVFYNLAKDNAKLGDLIRSRCYVSRIWGIKEDSATYARMVRSKINFIALYKTTVTEFNSDKMEGAIP